MPESVCIYNSKTRSIVHCNEKFRKTMDAKSEVKVIKPEETMSRSFIGEPP